MRSPDQPFTIHKSEIKRITGAGSLAPSGGNSQPWKVIWKKNTLQIYLDPKRIGGFLDSNHYASLFGLGCFLKNALIAADSLALKYDYKISDTENSDNPIVTVVFTHRSPAASSQTLYPYIAQRATNRQLSNGKIIEPAVLKTVTAQLDKNQHYQFHTQQKHAAKKQIAVILGKADAIRYRHHQLLQQMMQEFRWSEKEAQQTRDGIELKTLELPQNMAKIFTLLKEHPQAVHLIPIQAFEEMVKPLILNSSHICCLSTSQPISPSAVVTGGMQMQEIWLRATQANLALQPWSILPFMMMRVDFNHGTGFSRSESSLVTKLGKLIKQAFDIPEPHYPLFLFRLSYAKPPTATSLHRTWTDFTTIAT